MTFILGNQEFTPCVLYSVPVIPCELMLYIFLNTYCFGILKPTFSESENIWLLAHKTLIYSLLITFSLLPMPQTTAKICDPLLSRYGCTIQKYFIV